MSGLSLFGRDQMLAAFFIPDDFTYPDTLWVALTTVIPAPGATGSDLVEPLDEAYLRGEYGVGSDFWEPTGRGGVANRSGVYFPQLSDDYGLVVGWALCDTETGGNTYVVGELEDPVALFYDPDNDQVPVLGVGSIVVRQT